MKVEARLLALAGIRHAFFTRAGGVSTGLYESLNGGTGSRDVAANVAENRARMAAALRVEPSRLLTAYQTHSPDVAVVEAPWPAEDRPRLRARRLGVWRQIPQAAATASADATRLVAIFKRGRSKSSM